MSSPNLNVVTLLGSGLTYSSAYLFGIETPNSVTKPSTEMLVQVGEKTSSLLQCGLAVAHFYCKLGGIQRGRGIHSLYAFRFLPACKLFFFKNFKTPFGIHN